MSNDHLVLVAGPSASGKSASLKDIKDPAGVMYLNCESNKKLPFPSQFQEYVITSPQQVTEGIIVAESRPQIHTVVVDSLTFLMDMAETLIVSNATNTMTAWNDFAQYFKILMQQHVASSTKNIIFTAHTSTTLNEKDMVLETKVPIKGQLKNNGIEAYFSTIISTKVLPVEKLEPFESDLLVITDHERALGFKYVFQTQLTAETVNERIRSGMGMWKPEHTFIDNNLQLVMDRLHDFYQ